MNVVSVLLRTEEVPLSDITWPHGLGELDESNVVGIMDSMEKGGQLPPIQVNERYEGLIGRHRFEAAGRLGYRTIRCDVVAYPSRAIEEAHVILENLHRRIPGREERDRLLARLVELFEEQGAIDRQNDEKLPGAPRGRPESPRRQAIKDVANQTPFSESTIERAVKAQEPAPEAPRAPKPLLVETRIRNLASDAVQLQRATGEILDELIGVSGRTGASKQVADAVEGISAFIASMQSAAEEITRARAKVRKANMPSCQLTPGCIREGGHPAKCEVIRNNENGGPATKYVKPPKTGLGGKRLQVSAGEEGAEKPVEGDDGFDF